MLAFVYLRRLASRQRDTRHLSSSHQGDRHPDTRCLFCSCSASTPGRRWQNRPPADPRAVPGPGGRGFLHCWQPRSRLMELRSSSLYAYFGVQKYGGILRLLSASGGFPQDHMRWLRNAAFRRQKRGRAPWRETILRRGVVERLCRINAAVRTPGGSWPQLTPNRGRGRATPGG